MTKKTKLELTWPGKDERPKLEPRILIENPDKSYHAATRLKVPPRLSNARTTKCRYRD